MTTRAHGAARRPRIASFGRLAMAAVFLVLWPSCFDSEASLRKRIEADPAATAPRLALARYYEGRDEVEEAMEQYEGALAVNPKLDEAIMPLARLYAKVGLFESAREYAEVHLWKQPKSLEATLLAARANLSAGDEKSADEYLKKARALGYGGPLQPLKVSETYGLIGLLRYRRDTKHFQIRASSAYLAKWTAEMADNARACLGELYGLDRAKRQIYRIYVFETRDQYRAYAHHYHAARSDYGGFFAPRSRKIVLFSTPDTGGEEDWFSGVFVHELSHLFMYQSLDGWYGPAYPLWLDEGLAEYHRSGIPSSKAYAMTGTPPDLVRDAPRLLEGLNWTPLSVFLTLSPIRARRHYVQAWGMVHWMRSQRPEDFRRYMEAIRKHENGRSAFIRIFGPLPAVEEAVKAHLATM